MSHVLGTSTWRSLSPTTAILIRASRSWRLTWTQPFPPLTRFWVSPATAPGRAVVVRGALGLGPRTSWGLVESDSQRQMWWFERYHCAPCWEEEYCWESCAHLQDCPPPRACCRRSAHQTEIRCLDGESRYCPGNSQFLKMNGYKFQKRYIANTYLS